MRRSGRNTRILARVLTGVGFDAPFEPCHPALAQSCDALCVTGTSADPRLAHLAQYAHGVPYQVPRCARRLRDVSSRYCKLHGPWSRVRPAFSALRVQKKSRWIRRSCVERRNGARGAEREGAQREDAVEETVQRSTRVCSNDERVPVEVLVVVLLVLRRELGWRYGRLHEVARKGRP